MAIQDNHYYEVYNAVFARDGRICQYCESTTASQYVLEHVVPERRNGPTEMYNTVVACGGCNRKKGNAIWIPRNIAMLEALDPEWAALLREHAEEYRPPHPTKSYHLDPDLTWRLHHWAITHGMSQSDAATLALEKFLEGYDPPKRKPRPAPREQSAARS